MKRKGDVIPPGIWKEHHKTGALRLYWEGTAITVHITIRVSKAIQLVPPFLVTLALSRSTVRF